MYRQAREAQKHKGKFWSYLAVIDVSNGTYTRLSVEEASLQMKMVFTNVNMRLSTLEGSSQPTSS